MAYQQGYYDQPAELGYQDDGQYLGMGETEMMYYQDQYNQNGFQFQQAGQYPGQQLPSSEYQPFTHRYSVTSYDGQGYAGYDVIPEEVGITAGPGGMHLNSQRHAESAMMSWKAGKIGSGSLTSGLSLSTRSSDIDLKDFLAQRGNHPLEGLHKAAAHGDRARIMHIMRVQGPDAALNELDNNGCTPLMYAAVADSVLAIEILLSYSAKREQVDSEGRTAVHYATFFGKHRALKFLVEAASDWTPRDVYGRTPLHWACVPRSPKCLSVLLKHAELVMGDINVHDIEGMTPLHCAAHMGRSRHITLLNSAVDCDSTVVDNEGKTALHWTVTNKDPSCILALIDGYPPLLNRRDMNSNTVLHLVAASGAAHLVDTLIRLEGIEIDVKDASERTPLHLASIDNHPDVVKILLDAHAVDSYIDYQGKTALHYSVENNSLASLRAFAELTDVTHIPDNDGKTPLMVAAQNGFDQAVEILVSNSSVAQTIDSVDGEGKGLKSRQFSIVTDSTLTPSFVPRRFEEEEFSSSSSSSNTLALHLAAQAGSSGCVTALLAKGADPNLVDNQQQTPLFSAVEGGHSKCIEALVSKGSQPDMHDLDGQAPLHKAVLHGQEDSLLTLISCGADLSNTDGNGYTALHLSAYVGRERLLRLLLEHSADPNIQDPTGATASHLAAIEGNTECLKILLGGGANANIMDFSEDRNTALDYALLNGHEECTQVLKERGGMAISGIKELAALRIQTAYRGHRARVLRSLLAEKHKAATTIAAYVRGLIQRRKFSQLKLRHKAAIIIQALVRGYVERVKYRIRVARFREQESLHKLMEEQYQKILEDRESSILKTFHTPEIAEQYTVQEDEKEERERERKLRLEAAMKMRDRYNDKQRRWQEFREAERLRRIDKSNQEELDYYSGVIAESQARRQYATLKFKYMTTVRSHHQAAVVIQRAFRRMKARRAWQKKVTEREETLRRIREQRAARIIQRAWRMYRQYKLYVALNFKSVLTSPVIALGRRRTSLDTLRDVNTYEQSTSITGNPRRKMHLTELSGFKVFRPTTQELLFKPGGNYSRAATVSPRSRLQSRPTSILSSTAPQLNRLKAAVNLEHTTRQLTFDKNLKFFNSFEAKARSVEEENKRLSKKKKKVLPKLLFQQSPIKDDADTQLKAQTPSKIHLPAIVSS